MKFGVLELKTLDGQVRQYPLDLPSALVGRGEGCSVRIDDPSVARRHARILLDSGRLLVEDLGSATGTFVAGRRLPPNAPALVERNAELRFGNVSASYAPPAPVQSARRGLSAGPTATGITAPATLPGRAAPEDEHTATIPGAVRVALRLPTEAVDPGGAPIIGTLSIHNRGNVVDDLSVSVLGMPPEWVRLSVEHVILVPNQQADVSVVITVPRSPEAVAGVHELALAVDSAETSRQAVASADITVNPFDITTLALHPVRSKRKFRLVAENKGNRLATYSLSGTDDESSFIYDFEAPTLELPPGRGHAIGFSVRTGKRRWFGKSEARPFKVVAQSTADEHKATVDGQLVIAPPLEKLKPSPILTTLAMFGALIVLAFMFWPSDGGGVKTVNAAEAAYKGVHMCDKDDQPAGAQAGGSQDTGGSSTTASGGQVLHGAASTGAPFFAQNDPQWGAIEYARAKDPEFGGKDWCGNTIEQCGCAMTSVTTVMAIFQLLTMPDGQPLTPKTVNEWFNLNAHKTGRGWVSQGYVYGDVMWTAANQLSGEIRKVKPDARTIRFLRFGTGSEDEIREQLRENRPVVLEVPGHWIAAVALEGDRIVINDPFYRDRKYLDTAYPGKVKSSVLFEPSEDLSAVVITVPLDARVRVTDKEGHVVGTLNTGSPEDAAKTVQNNIPGASFSSRTAWRDPTCVESAPPTDAGTNQIILPGNASDYKIEVLDTAGGNTSVAVHTYDQSGTPSVKTIDSKGKVEAQMAYDPSKAKPDLKVIQGTDTSGDGGQASGTATAKATPKATPGPGTTQPGGTAEETSTSFDIDVPPGVNVIPIKSAAGFLLGDAIRIAPGKPNEEDNTIVGFGSFILATPLKFAHAAGEKILRIGAPRAPTIGPPPSEQPPPVEGFKPPSSVGIACSQNLDDVAHQVTLICVAAIKGDFSSTRWTVDGKVENSFTGQTSMLLRYSQDATVSITLVALNGTAAASFSTAEHISFPTGGGGSTAPTSGGLPQTPPAPIKIPTASKGAVSVACQYTFAIEFVDPHADFECTATFPLKNPTTITWDVKNASPSHLTCPGGAGCNGNKMTLRVQPAPPGALTPDVKVPLLVTVCEFSNCITGTRDDTIPGSKVALKISRPSAPTNSTVTFFAAIEGGGGPAGGTVLFATAGDGDKPGQSIGFEVPIIEFAGISFASLTVQGGLPPLDTEGLKSIRAFYSGGVNVFGSKSQVVGLTMLPPVIDVCNSVDDNHDAPDGFKIGPSPSSGTPPGAGYIDGDCDFSVPKDIGAGTYMNRFSMAAIGPAAPGDNTNDLVMRPAALFTIAGGVSRDPVNYPQGAGTPDTQHCPQCFHQVYVGLAPNEITNYQGSAPHCVLSSRLTETDKTKPGDALQPKARVDYFPAPNEPGLYYMRASATTQFSCGQPPSATPDLSVGRLVVKGGTTTSLTASASSVVLGQEVTLTATVLPVSPATAAPKGSVTFCIGTCANPANQVGTGVLNTLGKAELKFDTHRLSTVWSTANGYCPSNVCPVYATAYPLDTGKNPYTFTARFEDNVFYDTSETGTAAPVVVTITPKTADVHVEAFYGPDYSAPLGSTQYFYAKIRCDSFGSHGGEIDFYNEDNVKVGTAGDYGIACPPPPNDAYYAYYFLSTTPTYSQVTEIDTGNFYPGTLSHPAVSQDAHVLWARWDPRCPCLHTPNYAAPALPNPGYPDPAAVPNFVLPAWALTVKVDPIPTETTMTISPSSAALDGADITITATITHKSFEDTCTTKGLPCAPTGTIYLCDGLCAPDGGTSWYFASPPVVSVQQLDAFGFPLPAAPSDPEQATFTVSPSRFKKSGAHEIGARYVPTAPADSTADDDRALIWAGSTSGTSRITTSAASTTTSLRVGARLSLTDSLVLGEKTRLTATVSRTCASCTSLDPITGTITFHDNKSGKDLAIVPVNTSGMAEFDFDTGALYGANTATLNYVEVGDHDLIATFSSGTNEYLGSTGNTVTVTIDPVAPDAVTLVIAPASLVVGGSTTLVATVAAGDFGPVNGGRMYFCLDSCTIDGGTGEPTNALTLDVGAFATVSNNVASAKLNTATFSTGTKDVVAYYYAGVSPGWLGNYGPLESPTAALSVGTPNIFLTISPSGPFADNSGQSISISATVSPGGFAPYAGTMYFHYYKGGGGCHGNGVFLTVQVTVTSDGDAATSIKASDLNTAAGFDTSGGTVHVCASFQNLYDSDPVDLVLT